MTEFLYTYLYSKTLHDTESQLCKGVKLPTGYYFLRILIQKHQKLLNLNFWGAWMAQSVKPPTLVFGSGRDLRVAGWSPHIRLRA